MTDLELQQALSALPHGPEFRFLDRLTKLEPGRTGTAEYHVRGDELFLRGHFPGEPIMPGVLLIEAAAQLVGVVAQSDPQLGPLAGLKLTAVNRAKILGTVRPGEVVRFEARLTARLGNLIQGSVTASANDRLLLQADVALSGDGESASALRRHNSP